MIPPLASRVLPALVLTAFLPNVAPAQSSLELTGFNRLSARLGEACPTGSGMLVGQVEAPASGAYAPDVHLPELLGKTISRRSGVSSNPSSHATAVGQYWFGTQSSIARGITLIDAYEANHWLGSGFLNGSGATPPQMVAAKIFNHSWIGSAGLATNTYLRKLDAAVESQGLIVCAGVNNGRGPLDVALLSHGFNVIAVGRSDGSHHAGYTALGVDGPGRMKPELVAPAGATSYSTPLVSGAVALLVESAWNDPRTAGNSHAALPEVIKAILMAGARHREGWSNGAVAFGSARGTTVTPLDPIFGADTIDVDHSHWILTAGEQPAAQNALFALDTLPAGWTQLEIGSGKSRWLRFQVEARKSFVSIVLAWNREVAPGYATWSLVDLDLELWAVDEAGVPRSMIGTPEGELFSSGNALSISKVDNVEHLYLEGLSPGEYLLEVRRAQDELPSAQAALAWHFECAPGMPYGESKTTSLGTQPKLRSTGMPSLFGADFELIVSDAVPEQSGIVLSGSQRASLPFKGGTLLVQGALRRSAIVRLDETGAAAVRIEITPEMVGTSSNFQFWFRDPNQADGTGTGLSDALEVPFCP